MQYLIYTPIIDTCTTLYRLKFCKNKKTIKIYNDEKTQSVKHDNVLLSAVSVLMEDQYDFFINVRW